ncbi:LysM peptidoglycan-binding domain-containing protein [Bizionia myxarmorum]|uniref:LysM peptidoglycan-binding domain-containing protein n=1 Tax=Bizionia myxarmorum TaxID=291186 RepID=A0A5D0R5P2_9FLAO|nr:LysM peptidoglycan-binding domain-containing protein [Bizionia myxarmorum]TYB76960.1 LysM peptidoglycan-binding domain-containing protein [Bizionia myxarmorum]
MKKLLYILGILLFVACGSASQAQNYKTHKVQAGETVESIARQYQLTAFDIYALNPDAKKELKRNAVLIIPNKKIDRTAPHAAIERELTGFKKHTVKRKETLYSLAKEYNVAQDEIKKHNTFLYANNLRKGDEIKIPIYKKVFTVSKPDATDGNSTGTTTSTKKYTVLPKEGKWRIAYKFGITVAELDALNPGINAVLNDGEIINVPNINNTEEKPVDSKYSYYEVLPKEGFYRLKVKLGLDQDQLEALNPELVESGLKVGMVLKVPFSANVEDENIKLESKDLTNSISSYKQKHIAIMLPFKLNKLNTDSISDTKAQILKDPFIDMSLDFYSGVVVALDSLKNLGVNLKVDIYDTKNTGSEISSILNNNNFNDVHAVIGPFMPENIKRVANELQGQNIPVVSPLAKNLEISENVFQSRPSEDLLKEKIVKYVNDDATISQIIIISDESRASIANDLKNSFPTASLIKSRKNKSGTDGFYIYDTDITSKLKPGKNFIFFETTNAGFVSNVTSKLNSLISKDRQIILGTTEMGAAFEDDEVSNSHLSNLQFTFAAIAKTFNEDDNNSFAIEYQKRYGVSPNKIAVRGFDVTMDVVLRLVNFTDLYESVSQAPLTEYVENKFAYKKKVSGGFYNDTVYLVKYEDLKIKEIKL